MSIERMTQMKIDSTEPDWQARALAAERTVREQRERAERAEATLQKIIDHDLYDDFAATRIAREHLEAEHERP